jgi:hypothetical protein
MKSCSILFATLLFVTGFSVAASQSQPQSTANTTAATPTTSPEANAATQTSSTTGASAVAKTPEAASNAKILAPGATIVAEFAGSLNVKKLKPGDKVKAVLAQDLIAGGQLVAKYGSKVIGHVTEVKKWTPNDPESRLGVVFDKILLKKHKELDFQAIVQALAPPVLRRSRVDEPDQMMPPAVLSVGGSSVVSGPRGSRTSSTATTMSSSVSMLGPMATVQSTPGSNPGDSMTTIRTGNGANTVISGGVGMHGVYGLKNLQLRPPQAGTNSGPAIVSTKSDVKLQSGSQVVMLVVD